MEKVNAIGRRKAAVARVYLTEGSGNITIDKRPLDVYFPSSILQYVVKQPLNTLDVAAKYDIVAHLDGGGYKGQAPSVHISYALDASCLVSKFRGWTRSLPRNCHHKNVNRLKENGNTHIRPAA